MRRIAGQAVRHAHGIFHFSCGAVLAVASILAVGVGGLVWRLDQGPIDLGFLIPRLERLADTDNEPLRFHIGHVSLAWEGFSRGVDRPLDLRLNDVIATTPDGATVASSPRVEVSVSFLALLTARLRPRAIELDGPTLSVTRAENGAVALNLGGTVPSMSVPPTESAGGSPSPFAAMLRDLGRPAASDHAPRLARFSQLRRVRILGASLTVDDQQLGLIWHAPDANIDLLRRPRGGVDGKAQVSLVAGEMHADLTVAATQADGGRSTHLVATLSPVRPSVLAATSPTLAKLSGAVIRSFDAPVGATLTADLDADLRPTLLGLHASLGPGGFLLQGAPVALGGAEADIAADVPAGRVTLPDARVTLAPGPATRGGPAINYSTIDARGSIARKGGGFTSSVELNLDHVAMTALGVLWPKGVGEGARSWVVENVTNGTAHDAHVVATVDDKTTDPQNAELITASGTLLADDVAVHWLRPVPPVEHGNAKLTIIDPDTIEIAVQGGVQMRRGAGGAFVPSGLVTQQGTMRVTGIEHPHQFGDVSIQMSGPLADTLTLLKEPRLKLFEHVKLDLGTPSGEMAGRLTVHIPLEKNVDIDQIPIRGTGHVSKGYLSGIVAGRDLDDGALDFDANNDGMTLSGTAKLAGIPSTVSAAMDFRAGPGSQVLQKFEAKGKADAAALVGAGLRADPLTAGTATIDATYAERRDGRGDLRADADLTDAALDAGPLDWTKPIGAPGSGALRMRLVHGHIAAVDQLSVEGPALSIKGSAQADPDGAFRLLRIETLRVGKTDATGTVRLPPVPTPGQPAQPIRAEVSGSVIDLSGRLTHGGNPSGGAVAERPTASAKQELDKPGPPYVADLRFATAIGAHDRTVSSLMMHVDFNGWMFRAMRVEGRTGANGPFHLDIATLPGPTQARRLTARAADAGALLATLDILGDMRGGTLTVDGRFDDREAPRPLSGTAEITDARITNAPAVARVLQAASIYGMLEALRGQGLAVNRLIAPFSLADRVLTLTDARAFNASLGVTLKGRVDLDRDDADLSGTIVPSYALNTLPGRIPLIGKLFSPEKGGGLFAADFSVRGRLSDPQVRVNPLSALTPGFLRWIFGGT